jgi:hypothetical protein
MKMKVSFVSGLIDILTSIFRLHYRNHARPEFQDYAVAMQK